MGDNKPEKRSDKRLACDIEFELDREAGLVYARLHPSSGAPALDLPGLRTRLEEAGFGDFHTTDETLESLLQQTNSGRAQELVVAERRDARPKWKVNRQQTAIYLTLEPARGGRPATEAALRRLLVAKGVQETFLQTDALARAVSRGHAEALCVARARAPEHGRDARFVSLVARDDELALREDERGQVDLHHLYDFVMVEAGAPLLRREPASGGVDGEDVFGRALPAESGRDQSFETPGDGVERDPQNPDLLRASRGGHPVFGGRSVRVDPVLHLKAVDIASGDVDYDGSVSVDGNVASGYTLRASGDVHIKGMVERAHVHAGGSLTIQGGVMGEEQKSRHDGAPQRRTRLSAGRSVTAKFFNLADVRAREDILVQEYALQCRLQADGTILLGQPTGRGALMGGFARAGCRIEVNRLGSDAGVATELELGRRNSKRRLLQRLKEAQNLSEHNWNKVSETLACIERGEVAKPPREKLQRLYETRDALRHRRQRIKGLIERLAARRPSGAEPAELRVQRHQYANISLNIDGVRRYFGTEHGPARWVRAGAELHNRL